jgi:hypothetical protein
MALSLIHTLNKSPQLALNLPSLLWPPKVVAWQQIQTVSSASLIMSSPTGYSRRILAVGELHSLTMAQDCTALPMSPSQGPGSPACRLTASNCPPWRAHNSTQLSPTSLTPSSSWLLYIALARTAQRTLLLLTFVTWRHVFHCSATCPLCTGQRGNAASTALLLLHDIAVTEKCLSCCCLATRLGFQQTCYNIIWRVS